MSVATKPKGPWTHRFLVHLFSLLFGLLVYWLLGFAVRDIATWPGPDYEAVQRRFLDQQQVSELKQLRAQIEETQRETEKHKSRQAVLRDSTNNSEQTMNRLLEFQRLTLQKGLTPSVNEAEALAESQRLFLGNQRKYQELNEAISRLQETLSDLENRLRISERELEQKRQPIAAEYQRLQNRHQLMLAGVKLLVLMPLLIGAVWLFLKKGSGLYAPLVYGFGIAVLIKAGMVMHEHFPRRYFKYALIGLAIALVARILVYLLRMMAFPKVDWLLKQYREAYEHFQCPVCAYPIRRGPLKFLFWNRRSLKRLNILPDPKEAADEPYVCPVCGTALFEECGACHGMRHSLLPVCARCGAEKSIAGPAARAGGG